MISLDPTAADLDRELRTLRDALLAAEARHEMAIRRTHACHRASARNLVHYVELRSHDIRDLQAALTAHGLSSLGRSEGHVLDSLDAVISMLGIGARPDHRDDLPSLAAAGEVLDANAARLLGPCTAGRTTRIMVTMPGEAATDAALVGRLVDNGMDVARLNCAHDDADAWLRMLGHLHVASEGRDVRIAMDLGGPKLRTGPLEPGPRVRKVAPVRDAKGRVTAPALVHLHVDGEPAGGVAGAFAVPVRDAAWLARRTIGEIVSLVDARGARRRWTVVEVDDGGCSLSAERSTYVETGSTLVASEHDRTSVGELPAVEQAHRVRRGDHVVLTRSLEPARPVVGATVHRIGCTLGEAFACAGVGERVFLDDGKIGGEIVRVDESEIEVRISEVRPGGANLRAGKGINLPDTELRMPALTEKDREDLAFVARHADLVNLSFVRIPADVELLLDELERLDAAHVGIVLKIENLAAFRALPELLLTAMRHPDVGVMIARGDLAVEVGFERLAEVQEEILWLCEAAHVPVIWATQVLDTLARTGRASRAEVTDAAMAERAECVMLNKGPYIVDAMVALDSILGRMREHQDKKRSLLRRLRAWDRTEDSLSR